MWPRVSSSARSLVDREAHPSPALVWMQMPVGATLRAGAGSDSRRYRWGCIYRADEAAGGVAEVGRAVDDGGGLAAQLEQAGGEVLGGRLVVIWW